MSRLAFRNTLRALSLFAAMSPLGFSGSLDILWFTAGTADGGTFYSYEQGVRNLAADASSSTSDSWNVTFWDSSFDPAATPVSAFDVLVVASPQFIDGADYSALNANLPSFGSRVIITGLDADWHYMNTPGTTDFDGPKGLLLNAVNWAAQGTGLGAVFLAPQSNISWNFQGLGNEASYDEMDNIVVPDAAAASPVNAGLSSNGLSNWATSGKEAWDSFDTSRWAVLQLNGDDTSKAVTLASVATSSAVSTVPPSNAPEVSTGTMLTTGILGVAFARLRRRRTAARIQ